MNSKRKYVLEKELLKIPLDMPISPYNSVKLPYNSAN